MTTTSTLYGVQLEFFRESGAVSNIFALFCSAIAVSVLSEHGIQWVPVSELTGGTCTGDRNH